MLSQLFMAKSAFFSFERKMQVIANNIHNAQTVGYKKRRLEMESLFPLILERAYTEFEDQVSGSDRKRRRYMEYGQGVRIADLTKDFSTGTISITNQPFDIAIEGEGMLQFRLPDGTRGFSRAGNLHQDAEGNVFKLRDKSQHDNYFFQEDNISYNYMNNQLYHQIILILYYHPVMIMS